jgi:LCP family protein required for cell wall assembly
MRILKISMFGLLSVIFIAIGYYTYSILSFASSISSQDGTLEALLKDGVGDYTPPIWDKNERVNILLLGVDSRTALRPNEIPRSDSIMIASIDPQTKKATLFSILRDTYVKVPGYSNERINGAITHGGPHLVMQTVSNLIGIPIQYYVYTDFEGFIALVDAIGGIEIDVEKNMKYIDSADDHLYDIDLKKGLQELNGKEALQYVRFRHDALSDFSRTERQRKFLSAVASKMQTTSSMFKLPKILNSMDPYIQTNIDLKTMLRLGNLAFDAKSEELVTAQLPPTHLLQEKVIRGAQVISVDPAKLKTFVSELLARNIDAEGKKIMESKEVSVSYP